MTAPLQSDPVQMPPPLTEPLTDSLTIVLEPSNRHEPWRVARRRLTTALRSALGRPATGWRVRRVPYVEGIVYDLLPPPGDAPSVEDAWNLTYALEALPDVLDAEPSFAVLQDAVVPPGVEPEDLPQPAGTVAPADFEPCNDDEAPAVVDARARDWSVRLIDAPCAWILPPPEHEAQFGPGRARGDRARIGHPDAGYRRHTDYLTEPEGHPPRVLHALERDFVDGKGVDDPFPAQEEPGGQHGLSTGSVIMSSDKTGSITGVAPEADIVPLRVTKPRGFLPAPILFDSGARALRDAIGYAVHEADCYVISISLGWFANRSLHAMLRDAVKNDVIVCAAAGNYTPFVVWPAAYPETIAVGGCNAMRQAWPGSARGRAVDVSAPADDVWVPSFTRDRVEAPAQSKGTSFAVATVAGVAALWLAYHNRDFLLARYRGEFTLTDVFRYVLSRSSDAFADAVGGIGLGVGIVNARKVLQTPLPTITEMALQVPAFARAPLPDTPLNRIAAAFPDVSRTRLERWLADAFNVPVDQLNTALSGVEDEVIFQIATDATLRARLTETVPVAVTPQGMPVPHGTPAPAPEAQLATSPLSTRLRSRLQP